MKRTLIQKIICLCLILAFILCIACSNQAAPIESPAPVTEGLDENTAPVTDEEPAAPPEIYIPGAYTGKSSGHEGIIKVTVTVTANEITNIEVDAPNETPGIGTVAIDQLPGQILKNQSADVDSISGATETSEGIIFATKDALSQAEK